MEQFKFDPTFMLWNLLDISEERSKELMTWIMDTLKPSVDRIANKLADNVINDFKQKGPNGMHENMMSGAMTSGKMGLQGVAECFISLESEEQFAPIEKLYMSSQIVDTFRYMVQHEYFSKTTDFFNKQFPGMFPDPEQ